MVNDGLTRPGVHVPLMSARKALSAVGATADELAPLLQKLQEKMAATITVPSSVNAHHETLVDLLLLSGEGEAALQEARIYFYSCDSKDVQRAIDLVTAAYKAIDFNLSRANRFLRYQRFGPAGEDEKLGTDDDIPDILATVPPLRDPERAKLFTAAIDRLPNTWIGYKHKARGYALLDQAENALEALKKSFLMCPVDQETLQGATDALTGFVLRHTRDSAAAETLAEYIMYGEEGKDGRIGTADDLKDPMPRIVKRLTSRGTDVKTSARREGAGAATPGRKPVARN